MMSTPAMTPHQTRCAAWFWCARAAGAARLRGAHVDEAFFRSICARIASRFPEAVEIELQEDQQCAV